MMERKYYIQDFLFLYNIPVAPLRVIGNFFF